MCRGVVEDCHIYNFLPVIAFQEEWEEEEWEEDDRFPVQVGDNLYIRMDTDEYHDYLIRKEEQAHTRFRKLGYPPYDFELFQQLYAEGKLDEESDDEDSSNEEENPSDQEED